MLRRPPAAPRAGLAGRGVAAPRGDRRRPALSARAAGSRVIPEDDDSPARAGLASAGWAARLSRTRPGARSIPSASWPRSPSSSRRPGHRGGPRRRRRRPRRHARLRAAQPRPAGLRVARAAGQPARRRSALPARGDPRRPPARQGAQVAVFLCVVGVFLVGLRAPMRHLVVGAVAAAGLLTATSLLEGAPGDLVSGLAWVAIVPVGIPALAGRVLRSRNALNRRLDEQAREIERNRAEREAAAVLGERTRIAGELHGVSAVPSRSWSCRPRPPSAACPPTRRVRAAIAAIEVAAVRDAGRDPAAARRAARAGRGRGARARSIRRWRSWASSSSARARPGCR